MSISENGISMEAYTDGFYKSHRVGSRRSAEAIVPIVLELIQPCNVVDVGCGLGTWLSVFVKFGIKDILGIDGSHVDRSMLQITDEQFLPLDLRKPLQINAQFDLAICMEVAEHLPEECAKTFVHSLTKLSPVVLFSAAIPFQGGTGHLNEQWPNYWANYFKDDGYEVVDCIRKRIWQDDGVEWWYAQNTLLFSQHDYVLTHARLKREFESTCPSQLSLVHPKKYLDLVRLQLAIQDIAHVIPKPDRFIMVDEDQLRDYMGLANQAMPFLERDGQYCGPPPDDKIAILELERLRELGARFVVFFWPAFWWLDYYHIFRQHLLSKFHCVLKNDRLVAFDLTDKRPGSLTASPRD